MKKNRVLLDSLRFCNYKLKILLNITTAILENKPTAEILRKFGSLVTTTLNIGQFLFYMFDNGRWQLVLAEGVERTKYSDIDISENLEGVFEEITMISRDEFDFFTEFDFIIPVIHSDTAKAFVLIGDIDDTAIGISPSIKNLQFIQTLANVIVMAVEKKRLIREALERERIKKELETASRIQKMLIPDVNSFPQRKEFSIHSFYLPHYDLGGDFFDFYMINENEFYFAIADVSGKGLSAALLMSNFQANLHALFGTRIRLEKIINQLNEIVLKNSNGQHFITMFLGKYHIQKKRLVYVNAGHNPPFLYLKKDKKLVLLDKGCVGIGMLDSIPKISVGKVRLNQPAKFLCYTDGVSEIRKDDMVDYGFKYIKDTVQSDESISQTIEKIVSDLNLTKENPNLFDDITMLGFDFN